MRLLRWTGEWRVGHTAQPSLLAFASAADRFKLVRPTMTEEPTLKIKNGWHPLYAIALGEGQYIGNDTLLDAGPDPDIAAMVSWCSWPVT